ncbi:MAG: ImmA/IrrE family metallo-endopeptidase [Myxococcota bacterium]
MSITRFGAPERFSLGFELREAPDDADTEERRASWGALEVWVGGRNLTRGRTTGDEIVERAEVPLLPLAEWVVRSWDYLLHEERLGTPSRSLHAAAWRSDSLSALPSDEDRLDALLDTREEWWGRHGFGSALPDFRIPDLHLRRFGPDVELSWDDREWRSVPGGITLVEQPGVAHLPPEEVATVMYGWCRAIADALEETAAAASSRLTDALDALDSPERQIRRLAITAGLDIERAARGLRRLAGVVGGSPRQTVKALLGLSENPAPGLVTPLPPPVLLYRSASPRLSERDLTSLLQLAGQADECAGTHLDRYREASRPIGGPQDITQDGVDRALAFREAFGVPEHAPMTGEYDIEAALLPVLGIAVQDLHLDDVEVDGVAIVAPGRRPTIAVNRSGRFAKKPWGRRMTLAHELCHLLYDGDGSGRVGIVSSPWAPYPLERRANAFAAMLLAPEPAVAAVLSRDTESWTPQTLREAMRALGVGVSTLTRHLQNLGWITGSEQAAWVDDLTEA